MTDDAVGALLLVTGFTVLQLVGGVILLGLISFLAFVLSVFTLLLV
jgi:hypothetical protein